MKQHLIILLLIVVNSLGATAQKFDPSGSKSLGSQENLKGKSDSLGYGTVKADVKSWRLSLQYSRKDSVEVDTVFNELQNYNPIYRRSVSNGYLGNLGSPYQSYVFKERKGEMEFLFLKPYEAYLKLPKDNAYYNTKTPFTRLSYATGGPRGRAENLLRVLHTQNITPNWNFGVNYNLISSDGQYLNQKTKIYDFNLFSSYEKNRYSLHFFLNQNRVSAEQNGGITNDSLVREANEEPENIQVNLTDSRSKLTNFNFAMSHSYSVGPEKTITTEKDTVVYYPGRIIYSSEYESDSHKFTEGTINKKFFKNSYFSEENTLDKTEYSSFRNTVQLVLNENQNRWIRLGARALLGNQMIQYNGLFNTNSGDLAKQDKNFHNNYVLLGLNSLSGDKLNWKAEATYFFEGYRQKDYRLSFSMTRWFDQGSKTHGLTTYGWAETKRPDYLLNEYNSNHFKWSNDFDSTRDLVLGIKYRNLKWKLEMGAQVNQVKNYIWFNSEGLPEQSSKNIRVITGWFKKDFVLGNFHLNQKLVGQNCTDKNVIPLPEFSVHSNNYYQNTFINGAFEIQTGFSVFYNTKFYAPDFNPATGQFFVQNGLELGDYPKVDLYFNFRIKRTRFFVMYEHANATIGSRNYFTTPHYPLNPAMLKYGLVWTFYN
ncbi:MAG: putative porin [Marinifilaceae bacterium]